MSNHLIYKPCIAWIIAFSGAQILGFSSVIWGPRIVSGVLNESQVVLKSSETGSESISGGPESILVTVKVALESFLKAFQEA